MWIALGNAALTAYYRVTYPIETLQIRREE
jgi:hypothetical protein